MLVRKPGLNGLWRHADFMKLWGGQTVSLFGSQITLLALPLTAVLSLKATSSQMGLLNAVQYLPWVVFSLFAGIWVDRLRRRPILIYMDLGRASLLLLIPLAAFMHMLSMGYLYLIGFLVGICTVFFEVAYPSFVPSLVERDQLVDGNSKLQISTTVAQVAGPSIAGAIIQIFTAPLAIILDSFSFLVSAFSVSLIRTPEVPLSTSKPEGGIWRQMGEGMRYLFGNSLLRAIIISGAINALFESAINALFILYATTELHLSPIVIGLIWACAGPSALIGAILAARLARRFGIGRILIWSVLLVGLADLLIPLASGSTVTIIFLLVTSMVVTKFLSPIYMVNQKSLRQVLVPNRLMGRVNSAFRLIAFGSMPVGALLGGALGQIIGMRLTIFVAALGTLLAFPWIYFSPVKSVNELPPPVEA